MRAAGKPIFFSMGAFFHVVKSAREGLRNISKRQSMASAGMANSTTTKAEETVRNLLYMGRWSMKKSVTSGLLCPQAKSRASIVERSSAHFIGPRT